MGRASRARGARHDRKPTFGTYNAGGGSRNKWDVIKDQFDKVDVLGLSEFSPSRGNWRGGEFAAEDHGRLLVGEQP
eukprot:COSAG01_NODE_26566_length_709_cov_4.442623_1_plen_75_part_01